MVHFALAAAALIALIGRNKSKYILATAFFVLFLFAALRYQYGNDYMSYYYEHLLVRSGEGLNSDEPLFALLSMLCPSFYILIAVTSFAFVYAVYQLTMDNVSLEYAWISVFLFVVNPYLFLMNLSAIRQCMAMVLFIAAVPFGMKRRFWPYAVLILLAAMIHKSAVILLPFYWIMDSKPFKPSYAAVVMVGMFVLLILVDIDQVVLWAAKMFNDANYSAYAQSGSDNSLRATLLTLIGWVYVLGNLPKLKGRELVYGKLYLVGLSLGVLAYQMSMLTRIQMYFDIFGLVAIPAILQANRGVLRVNPNRAVNAVWRCVNHFALPVLVFVIFILRYYSFFTNPSWKHFFTYQTIFSVL